MSEKLAESDSGREADECGGGRWIRAVRWVNSVRPVVVSELDPGGEDEDAGDGEEGNGEGSVMNPSKTCEGGVTIFNA